MKFLSFVRRIWGIWYPYEPEILTKAILYFLPHLVRIDFYHHYFLNVQFVDNLPVIVDSTTIPWIRINWMSGILENCNENKSPLWLWYFMKFTQLIEVWNKNIVLRKQGHEFHALNLPRLIWQPVALPRWCCSCKEPTYQCS